MKKILLGLAALFLSAQVHAEVGISALGSLASPANNDVLPIVDVSDTTQGAGGSTKKITVQVLGTQILLGNATTATALAADPSDCGANVYATTIAANGNLTCASITDASVASTITRDSEWDTIAEIETATSVNIIVSTEIDTTAELETLQSGVNILLETEIDASSELRALMDDETGGGLLVFNDAPTITGKITASGTAVNDDDCTGEQGKWWWDSTDSAFEWCNANTGAPEVLGTGGGSGCVPSGNAGEVLVDDGAGGCTAVTEVTIDSSGVTAPNIIAAGTTTDGNLCRFVDGTPDTVPCDVNTAAELETALAGANIIVSTEIDTTAELETLQSGVNILLETEIDASSELRALMDDETGGGLLVFNDAPTITGKITASGTAVNDDDCTGEQGKWWWDSTDLAFEWCNANTGVPSTLGAGGGLASADIDTSAEIRGIVGDESGSGALLFADGAIGAATATTASANDNDTSVATTAYVQTELTAYASDTVTQTNKTFNAASTGNVLTQLGYLHLTHPHLCDGTNATIGTTATAIGYGRPTFSNSVDIASNYCEFYIEVPADLDTSVDPAIKVIVTLGNTDTATQRYVATSVSVAASAVPTSATLANAVNIDFAGDGSGASGDAEISAYTTATGWGAALTPGNLWRIRLGRDGDTSDASTVNSTLIDFIIRYTKTQ